VARNARDPRPRVAITTEPVALVRWRARAPRLAFTAITALFALIGFRAVLAGPPHATRLRHTASEASNFADVEGFAQAFARAWLSYDPANPDAHAQALTHFLGSDIDADAGLAPRGIRPTRVIWTAVTSDVATRADTRLVTVAAALDEPSPLRYVAVPVTRDHGGLVVDGYPSLVGPPRLARDHRAPEQNDVTDGALSVVVRRALTNYLRGSTQDLAADLDRSVQLSPPTERLALESVDSLTWAAPGVVDAQVVARGEERTTYTLRYELAVVRRDRWYVRSLNPAVGNAAEKGVTK
jgi:Conjugative transposon protein TcpC